MAGKDWPNREGKEGPWKGVVWKRDGLWNVLRVRSAAILAAALSARSKIAHPWEKEDWVVICSALSRVLSLCVQAEATINTKSKTSIPTFELDIRYTQPDRPERLYTIPNVRRAPETEMRRATMITKMITAAKDAVPAVTIRFRTTDQDRFDTFLDIAKDEFARQLRVGVDGLYPRPTLGERPPETGAERQWDLRFRFCDFMRRFLCGFNASKAPAHPFTAFLLQPQYIADASNHIPSGSFGYGYVLDEGQRKYVREQYSDTAETDLKTLDSSRVPCAGGQCGRVYLTGRATEAHDVDDARQDSPTDLQVVEKRLLGDSVLLEIPVFGTRRMYTENAPDGPEFVLCLCLPKGDPHEIALNKDLQAGEGDIVSDVGKRVLVHTAPPRDALVLPAEAQVLCEMGQRLLSEYATAFGSSAKVSGSRSVTATGSVSAVISPVSASTSTGTQGSTLFGIIGESPKLNEVRNKIDRIARTEYDVLLLGESGVGKELVARGIHAASARHAGSIVTLNCAAMPQELVEEELFGYVKGAHSNAITDKPGLIESADQGTLFLDEIGDMAPAAQAKVLRVLEDKEVRRVGALTWKKVDVRLVAATSRPQFIRKDLYHRVSVMEIVIPPLRERKEDIPALAQHFAIPGRTFSRDALQLLAEFDWPGNVRQLRNVVLRGCVLIDSPVIAADDIVRKTEWPPRSEDDAELASPVTVSAGSGAQQAATADIQQVRTLDEAVDSMVSFVWSYPISGEESSASWAVKESAVLKGELGRAREEPGLGTAIVTTELATELFGSAANPRIDTCIDWWTAKAETMEPYRILARNRRAVTDEQAPPTPDLRHTFAWAVLLARSGRYRSLVHAHLKLILSTQEAQGGWPAEDGATTRSELFTALYAIECLHLLECHADDVPADLAVRIPESKSTGIQWLLKQLHANGGLWSSGVLREFAWDRVHASAWVLHRLAKTADAPVDGWRESLDKVLLIMLQHARDQRTWLGSDEDQQHRVEARIAAAVRRCKDATWVSASSRDFSEIYLGGWSGRAQRWLNRLDLQRQMDVATAAFLIGGIVAPDNFASLGGRAAL